MLWAAMQTVFKTTCSWRKIIWPELACKKSVFRNKSFCLFIVLAINLFVLTSNSIAQSFAPPKTDQSLMLVRSTMMALHHANTTGNYTVLRDLASPVFREANTASVLSAVFRPLREKMFDLSPTLVLAPAFRIPPVVSRDNFLQIAGSFPTQPMPLSFDIRFAVVGGQWKLAGLSVNPVKQGKTTLQRKQPTAKKTPPPQKKKGVPAEKNNKKKK